MLGRQIVLSGTRFFFFFFFFFFLVGRLINVSIFNSFLTGDVTLHAEHVECIIFQQLLRRIGPKVSLSPWNKEGTLAANLHLDSRHKLCNYGKAVKRCWMSPVDVYEAGNRLRRERFQDIEKKKLNDDKPMMLERFINQVMCELGRFMSDLIDRW